MGKREAPNHFGREPASKRRRMGAVDAAQQDEIDAIQELIHADEKDYEPYTEATVRPNIFGTPDVAATTGPRVSCPWDGITVGTGGSQRVGSDIHVKRYSYHFGLRWQAFYEAGGNMYPISTQRVRVDALWLKNCQTDTYGTTAPNVGALYRLKRMARKNATYARHMYVYGQGDNEAHKSQLQNVRWAKSWMIEPPAIVRHRPQISKNITMKVWDGTIASNYTAAESTNEAAHTAQVTHHRFSFPLPPGGFHIKYGTKDDGTDSGHIFNQWVPVFVVSWYGEYNNNNSDTTHIPENTDDGQMIMEYNWERVQYTDL